MCVVLDSELVAQKVHTCYVCGESIKVGEKHNILSNSENTIHLHNDCYKAVCDWGEEVGDEIMTSSDVIDFVYDKLRKKGIRPPKKHHAAVQKLYSKK